MKLVFPVQDSRDPDFPASRSHKLGWPWTEDVLSLPGRLPDGSAWPRISFVTVSYNQGSFLEETIRSVLLQGYPNLEYIIIDGGSSDNSVEIIRKYEKYLAYWVSECDHGQSEALNKGFKRSSGQILGWLNSDDFLKPGALATVATSLRNTNTPTWLIGHTEHVNTDSLYQGIQYAHPVTSELLFDWPHDCIPQQSTFWTRPLWERVGPLREDLHYAMDLALWFEMFRYEQPRVVDQVLACFRIHDVAKGKAAPFATRQEVLAIFENVLLNMPETERHARACQAAGNVLWWAHDSYQAGCYEDARFYLFTALRWHPALAFSRRALPLLLRLGLGAQALQRVKHLLRQRVH